MARKPSQTLTDGEVRLMNILWKKGHATVSEVVAGLPRRPPVAYNTVQTLLRILEDKGYVSHEQVGRRFVYRATVEQNVARRRALGHLVKSLFDDSPSLLVLNVLGDEGMERSEVERLKKLIGDA
jgi:BlaI family transcriptional regulator, penicillinase repressor